MREPIFITGIPRSGTSLTAGIIHACGAWGGKDFGSHVPNNPKGDFQNEALLGDIFENVLRLHCFSQYCACRTHMRFSDPAAAKAYVQAIHNMPENRPWFLKNHKLVYDGIETWPLWRLWRAAFPQAKWVVVRRDMHDIYASQASLYGEVREDTGAISRQLKALIDSGADCREIWPFQSLSGQAEEYRGLVEWLELDWNLEKVQTFVDLSLWHHGTATGAPSVSFG